MDARRSRQTQEGLGEGMKDANGDAGRAQADTREAE